MSNTSSAKKECRKSARKKIVNTNINSRIKTFIKKFTLMVSQNDQEGATLLLPSVQSEVMKAVSKGIIKHNTGSRKISSLAKKIKLLQSSAPVK